MEIKNLLEYGFKRVIEEVNKVQGVMQGVKESCTGLEKRMRNTEKHLEQMSNALLTLNETAAQCCGYLDKIAACELVTEQNVIGLSKQLEELKETETDGKLE